jgi:AcrR family transcriptional regulator
MDMNQGLSSPGDLYTLFTVTETTRNRILACACDLYLRAGFDGFSMRKLAQSVGVTAPALYRHFEGRENLLIQVVGEGYKVQIQYLNRALAGQSPAERFRMAGWEYLNFALENPRYYEILYSYAQILGPEVEFAEISPLVEQVHLFWLDRVQECMGAGLLKEDDPEVVARSFWALAHGLISIHQKRLLGLTEEEFREAYMRSATHLLSGVGIHSGWDSESQEERGRVIR